MSHFHFALKLLMLSKRAINVPFEINGVTTNAILCCSKTISWSSGRYVKVQILLPSPLDPHTKNDGSNYVAHHAVHKHDNDIS